MISEGGENKQPLLSSQNLSKKARYDPELYQKYITPRDEYNATYLSFLLLGAGFLFPWNTVITAQDYFEHLFSDKTIGLLFTVAYMCPNFFGLIFVVFFGAKFSFFTRIISGFSLFLVVTLALPFVKIRALSVFLVIVLGFSDAIVQGSIYGLAGQFNSRYVGAVMAGNGIAGLVVCILRIFTKALIPDDLYTSCLLYFSTSAFVNFLCIVVYWLVLDKSPVTKHYLAKSSDMRVDYITSAFNSVNRPEGFHEARPALDSAAIYDKLANASARSQDVERQEDGEEHRKDAMNVAKAMWASLMRIGPKIYKLGGLVGLNFFVTLALFPGLTFFFKSQYSSLEEDKWFFVILMTEFNLFDLIGRYIPRWQSLIFFTEKTIWIPNVIRLVFFPLFLLCLPGRFFTDDLWMYLFMAIFAFTNGYIGTLCMMYGPNQVPNKDKEIAGTVMVFFLTGGLTLGVIVGMVLGNMVDAGTL